MEANVLTKILKVVQSCTTQEQLDVADNMIKNYARLLVSKIEKQYTSIKAVDYMSEAICLSLINRELLIKKHDLFVD